MTDNNRRLIAQVDRLLFTVQRDFIKITTLIDLLGGERVVAKKLELDRTPPRDKLIRKLGEVLATPIDEEMTPEFVIYPERCEYLQYLVRNIDCKDIVLHAIRDTTNISAAELRELPMPDGAVISGLNRLINEGRVASSLDGNFIPVFNVTDFAK